MTLFTSCWLIIERIIIPEGFIKWFYLSFYIHPIFLCFCQIVLWIKLLEKWFFFLFSFLFRIIFRVSGFCITMVRFLKNRALFFVSSTLAADSGASVLDELVENEFPHAISNQNQIVLYATQTPYYNAYEFPTGNFNVQSHYKVGLISEVIEVVEETDTEFLDEDQRLVLPQKSYGCSTSTPSSTCDVDHTSTTGELSTVGSSISSDAEVELNLDGEDNNLLVDAVDMSLTGYHHSGSNLSSIELDSDISEHSQPTFSNHFSTEDQELMGKSAEEEVDSVYIKYIERMKWFDVLSRDRVHGIDAILSKNMGRPGSLDSMVPADLFIHSISWSKKAKEKLIRSLRSDFELVFVAHTCLSWEALHHQYRKVEAIANSASQNGVFFHWNVAERFQKFQIFLERFIEDDHLKYEGYSYYVQKRFSLNNLLQVPEVSVQTDEENSDRKMGEAKNVKANQVLKIIKDCIKVFWLFVKADSKKPTWNISNILWTNNLPVEDPRDLELLHDLRKNLKMKELLMKNLEGKKRCWLKKAVNPLVRMEREKDDFLFSMMDLKLIRKVLQMSNVSTSQLNWCQNKLDNVEIRQGKIYRTHQTHLFPSS
ncbi:hypothetical protein ACH5RR_014299 [Cinchona calisaya]|uniref:Uncharacterized protein n=1 Tax=Cinchona calisaya TaxID=153742 RepID=A0ABD3A2J2_9GENT